jgi:hypothetical protein
MALVSTVPANDGLKSLVMLSVLEIPVSVVRSGAGGVAGATRSTRTFSAALGRLSRPVLVLCARAVIA